MDEWRIERLDRAHVREGFDCGKRSLNDFTHALNRSTQQEKSGSADGAASYKETGDSVCL